MTINTSIQELCRRGRPHGEIEAAIRAQYDGTPWVWIAHGTIVGRVDGLPTLEKPYHTMGYGLVHNLKESTLTPGDTFGLFNQKNWLVVGNHSSEGNAHIPDTIWFAAVSISDTDSGVTTNGDV